MDNRDNRDLPPSEEERAGYRQIIAILVVILIAIIGLLLLNSYLSTPKNQSTVVRETTIQTLPGNSAQPATTRETTTIRESVISTQPSQAP